MSDNAAMTTFSRRLAGVELPRAAAIMLGLLLALALAAYVFSVVTYQPTAGGVVAALSLVGWLIKNLDVAGWIILALTVGLMAFELTRGRSGQGSRPKRRVPDKPTG